MPVSDRDYMRDIPPSRPTRRPMGHIPAFNIIIGVITGVFLLQFGFGWLAQENPFVPAGGVSVAELGQGHVWTLITYMFVHGSLGHFMLNTLMLWFLGKQVQNLFGSRHFVQIFLYSGIFGAALEMAVNAFVHGNTTTPLVGASASVFGLLLALAVLLPNEQITLLVYFIIPVPMRLWTMAKALCIIQIVFAIAGILFPNWLPEGLKIAYFAHLGGAAVGWFYARTLGYGGQPMTYSSQWQPDRRRERTDALAAVRARVEIDLDKLTTTAPTPLASDTAVDDILDKIHLRGIASLTDAERKLLELARAEIIKRDSSALRPR
jgi:membrane associated rhomboid family serine protease